MNGRASTRGAVGRGADLTGRVVVVTGAGGGQGLAESRLLVAAGAVVLAADLAPEPSPGLQQVIAEHGSALSYIRLDVTAPGDWTVLARGAEREFGRIDGLVNAAGLTTRGTLLDTTPELFDAHVAINLKGPFFLMQAAVSDMITRGGAGSIVNVITMSAHGGQPYLAPYVASKAGLIGLTKNAAHAHRWDKIRINGINIGWTETAGEDDIQRRFHGAGDDWLEKAGASLPMGKLGQVDDVARLAILLLSDASGVVTGSIIDWDQNVPGAHD